MKHYIGQLLLGTLVLGSACTNHREIIEGDTSVNVTFKAQQSPSTKGGDDDEMSVLIFKKKRTNLPKQKVSKRVHGLPRKNTCKHLIANRNLSISVGKRIFSKCGKF